MLENDNVVKKEKDGYETTRVMYIIEAAFEYFITLTLGGAYISRITAYLNIADTTTALLVSIMSLSHIFQFCALIIAHLKPVKRWVTISHVVGNTLASFLYFVPILDVDVAVKTVLLFVLFIMSRGIHYVINAPKISWLMSSVDDHKRGEFTAIKEIVSLLSGSVFIYLLGYSLDLANKKTAFFVVGIILIVSSIVHTITLIFSKEKPVELKEKVNLKENIKSLFTNKEFLKVILIFCVWYLVNYGVFYLALGWNGRYINIAY